MRGICYHQDKALEMYQYFVFNVYYPIYNFDFVYNSLQSFIVSLVISNIYVKKHPKLHDF